MTQVALGHDTAELIADWFVAGGTLAAAVAAIGIAVWTSRREDKRNRQEQRRQRRQIRAVFHHSYEAFEDTQSWVRIVNGSSELVTELRVEVDIPFAEEQGARQWWWEPGTGRYQLYKTFDVAFPGDDFTEYGDVWPSDGQPAGLGERARLDASERPSILLSWFDAGGTYWVRQGGGEPYESTASVPGLAVASVREIGVVHHDLSLPRWRWVRRRRARRSPFAGGG